jgi:hypothetical protein
VRRNRGAFGVALALLALVAAPARPAWSQAPRDYQRAPEADAVRISASWVNHNRDPLTLAFSLPQEVVRQSLAEFGISADETNRMAAECTGCTQEQYNEQVDAYYRSRGVAWKDADSGRRIYVDIPAVVARSRPRLRALARDFDQLASARQYGPEDAVGAMVAFVQAALLYKQPPANEAGRAILGFFPPPRALDAGFGDCDTKSALLAAVMTNFPGMRMIGVHVPRHYLVGLARVPRPGDAFIEYQGEPFVLIEPSGPARLPPGQIGPTTQAALATMSEVRIDPLF